MEFKTISLYFQKSKDPVANLLFVLPLLIFYGIGVVFIDSRAFNGADFITENIYYWLGAKGIAYAYGALAIAFLIAIKKMDQQGSFPRHFYVFIFIESLIYASVFGELTLRILWYAGLLGPEETLLQLPLFTRLLISIGAGVNEEIVFRMLLIGGAFSLLTKVFQLNASATLLSLILGTSFLFSIAHFISEPFDFHKLFFRWVAGILFAILYWFRGFGVAVYTHALYDIHVLIFR